MSWNQIIEITKLAKELEKEQMCILSDEKIENLAKGYVLYNDDKRNWVMEGMKLYRDQLNNHG